MENDPKQNHVPDEIEDDEPPIEDPAWEPEDSTEQEKLEGILGDVEEGWRIVIYRLQPTWCRGILETIDVHEPDFRLDVNELIKRWGGQRLHVKVKNKKNKIMGGGTISLFSYPPMRFGQPITMDDVNLSSLPRRAWNLQPYWDPNNPNQLPPAPPQTQQSTAPSVDLTKLLEMLQQGNRTDLDVLLKLLDRQAKAAPPPPPPTDPTGMMAQMMGMFKMFRNMQELFGGGAMGGGQLGSTERSDEDSIMPMIGELVRGMMGNRQTTPTEPSRPFLTPPRQAVPAPQIAPPVASRPTRPADDDDENLGRIADKLSRLDTDDAVDVVLEAIGNMPKDKRESAMQKFVSEFFGSGDEEDDLDESSIRADTFSQDAADRSKVKPQSFPVPNPWRK